MQCPSHLAFGARRRLPGEPLTRVPILKKKQRSHDASGYFTMPELSGPHGRRNLSLIHSSTHARNEALRKRASLKLWILYFRALLRVSWVQGTVFHRRATVSEFAPATEARVERRCSLYFFIFLLWKPHRRGRPRLPPFKANASVAVAPGER